MLRFKTLSFNELSPKELYEILALRQEVFIVEQDCVYLDADGKDEDALQVLGLDEFNEVQACARIFGKDQYFDGFAAIGRICTSAAIRSQKQGKALVNYCINQCEEKYPDVSIKISAQKYLQKFYQDFDFVIQGDEYLEDGIPHYAMIRKA